MKNKIPLTIALTASMSFGVALAEQAKAADAQPIDAEITKNSPIAQGEGKCASGKCGSLKKFSSVEVGENQEGKLVRVRDGKCGLSPDEKAQVKGETAQLGKCSNGVCGQ